MTKEQFDVVDLNDRPTGQLITKEAAHRTGAPHRVAAVFVFDDNRNLLLQVHEGHGGQLDHTVGGHVSSGEDYKTAAVREMKEEVGLEVSLEVVELHVMSDERFEGYNYFHFFGIFEAKADKNWQFVPHDEVKQLILMKLEAVVARMKKDPDKFTRGFINTLDAYLKAKKLPYAIDKRSLLKDRKGPWAEFIIN